jgi:tryptophan synthase alpha chain
MTRLESSIREKLASGRRILSVFVTAGLPSPSRIPILVGELARAGADIVELGVPFSDPLADGAVIQASTMRALGLGVTPSSVLEMVGEIRKITGIPVILMGYANPFLSYGLESFIRAASSSGVDGMIIPDLPPEESSLYRPAAAAAGVATVFLVAPTTPDERIAEIDHASTGFVYAVSTLGVTGERDTPTAGSLEFLRRARRSVALHPMLAGFGVSSPASALALGRECDGVIVGSAVVSRIEGDDGEAGIREAARFTSTLRQALDS